jgi:spore coat polysaccharide biosynthesis protein SpsF (cytidylyltransferase family)
MKSTKLIVIGIQARSASKRLPNKIHLEIDGKSILQHVIDNCTSAANYLNRHYSTYEAAVKVVLLCPKGDPLIPKYENLVQIYQGPEEDVLSRYAEMTRIEKPEYVVRVTADCIFLAPYMISRCIKSAVLKGCDYTTNCMVRTFMEGMDCEILSSRLINWLDTKAIDPRHREHVTIMLHEAQFPFRKEGIASVCHILDCYDRSDQKTSIDTFEDYQKAIEQFSRLKTKKRDAKKTGIFIL